jgi:hypothetical protein
MLTISGNTKQVIQDYDTVFDNSIPLRKNDPTTDYVFQNTGRAGALCALAPEKSALTDVPLSPVARVTHGSHPCAAGTHDGGSPTDASPSQPNTKKCIQVGRETYAVTSQPGTSYSSPDYGSILVIDSSSPSVPVKHTGEHTSTSEGLRRKKHKTGSKQKRSKTQPKTLEGAWRQL